MNKLNTPMPPPSATGSARPRLTIEVLEEDAVKMLAHYRNRKALAEKDAAYFDEIIINLETALKSEQEPNEKLNDSRPL